MVIAQGRCQAIGPKDEVLAKVMRRASGAAPPVGATGLRVVNETPGAAQ